MNYKERDAIIKELSVNYSYTDKDIFKILKDKGFKIDIRLLASQIKYFRGNAIIKSIENGGWLLNEKTIILMDNYLNKYPDWCKTLTLKELD
ncbi:MAG: hypothetical protein HF967_03445 [Methanosarcinales archaeon]|nr:hypothetical protein [Methanosarcinales archaeon]